MKKFLKLFYSITLLAGLFGCATPKMNLSTPTTATLRATNDKALVYFIRPNNMGFSFHASVYDGDKFVGFVPYQQKLPYLAEPGKHIFMVVSEAADFMNADLIAGETYYALVQPRRGMWRTRFSLSPVSRQQLAEKKVQAWIKAARLIENNDAAFKWAADNETSVMKKREIYFKKWNSKAESYKPFLRATDAE